MNKYSNLKSKFAIVVPWKELLTTVYDKPKEQLPMFNFSDNTGTRATTNDKTCAIILDYDDGKITFDDWIATNKGFKYFIYTTASNTSAKSKFRVVIPLRNWYSFEDIAIVVKDKFIDGLDKCSTSSMRRFFWPSKYDSDGNITRRYLNDSTAAYDDIVDLNGIVEFYQFLEQDAKTSFKQAFYGSCDCSTFSHVKAYLNTPFVKIRGNGGASMNGLFSSVCSCIKYNDEATLQKVIDKAKAEHWSDKELDRIIDKAEKLKSEKA